MCKIEIRKRSRPKLDKKEFEMHNQKGVCTFVLILIVHDPIVFYNIINKVTHMQNNDPSAVYTDYTYHKLRKVAHKTYETLHTLPIISLLQKFRKVAQKLKRIPEKTKEFYTQNIRDISQLISKFYFFKYSVKLQNIAEDVTLDFSMFSYLQN